MLMTMHMIHTYFCRVANTPLPGKVGSFCTSVYPGGSGSGPGLPCYNLTVRGQFSTRLYILTKELLANLEWQDKWKTGVEDEELGGLGSDELDVDELEIDELEIEELDVEELNVEDRAVKKLNGEELDVEDTNIKNKDVEDV